MRMQSIPKSRVRNKVVASDGYWRGTKMARRIITGAYVKKKRIDVIRHRNRQARASI